MSQRLELDQSTIQVQKLTAMQIAMATILELPLVDLEMRVRNEMDDNEALEESGSDYDSHDDLPPHEEDDHDDYNETSDLPQPEHNNELTDETANYLTEDDIPSYLLYQQHGAEPAQFQIASAVSSYEDLYRQARMHALNADELDIINYLIGSLDSDGYLRKSNETLADEMLIYQNLNTTAEEVGRLVEVLQSFEPRGIAARSLQECLRLQVDSPDNNSPLKALQLSLLDKHFEAFAAHHWDLIKRRLKLSDEAFESLVQSLLRLNPKPGGSLSEASNEEAPTIVPDFYVHLDADGVPSIQLNYGEVPPLRVSRAFKDTLQAYSKQEKKLTTTQQNEYVYAKKKVNDAVFFLELMRRRRQTLLSVMQSIVQLQIDFFLNDDDENFIRPMVLKDVADASGLDISTVSRVNASKYVQTDFGIYPLKYFFSTQFTAESGEEIFSRKAKLALREIVDKENKKKPFNDEKLALEMQHKGHNISRRTVAKYREQLGIPPSRLRKE